MTKPSDLLQAETQEELKDMSLLLFRHHMESLPDGEQMPTQHVKTYCHIASNLPKVQSDKDGSISNALFKLEMMLLQDLTSLGAKWEKWDIVNLLPCYLNFNFQSTKLLFNLQCEFMRKTNFLRNLEPPLLL